MEPVTIIIPAYNEEENIAKVIEKTKQIDIEKEILVVNDCSTDKTLQILQNIEGIRYISHLRNKGNGASVKTGIKNASNENIIVIDADGQHSPNEIVNMLKHLGEYDLVVGARTSGSKTKKYRNFANLVFVKLGSFLSGQEILDMTSGFRAFKRKHIMKFYNSYPNGFSFPTTSTMSFIMSDLNVKFVPMQFKERQGGKSKIKPFKDGLKFLLIIIRIVLFNPLKIFLPSSFVFVVFGILWSVRTMILTSQLSAGGLLFFITGINLFFFGFIFDQLVTIRKDIINRQD